MKRLGTVLLVFLLALTPAWAGTITAQVVEGGQPNATKVYAIPDAEIDRIVAAYQSDANVAVNGTATRAQVLLYVFNTEFVARLVAKVKAVEAAAQAAAIVPPVPINPQ